MAKAVVRRVSLQPRGPDLGLDLDPRIEVLRDCDLRQAERTSLNRLCDISDWRADGPASRWMATLREGVYVHRKAWEYAWAIHGLSELGVVRDDARAIAVGAGSEKPLYYFANHVHEMLATDLYDLQHEEGVPEMLTTPEAFAPFEYRRDHLRVQRMDGANLEVEDASFDFAFSLSSIEHFGSREKIRNSVSEMARVVRPGGVVCITTELILNRSTHNEYFTRDEIDEVILSVPGLALVGGPLDLRISQSLVQHPIQLDIEANHHVSPHIVLYSRGVLWTSLSLFLRKDG